MKRITTALLFAVSFAGCAQVNAPNLASVIKEEPETETRPKRSEIKTFDLYVDGEIISIKAATPLPDGGELVGVEVE